MIGHCREWIRIRQQKENQDTQRPKVCRVVVAEARRHLWRHILKTIPTNFDRAKLDTIDKFVIEAGNQIGGLIESCTHLKQIAGFVDYLPSKMFCSAIAQYTFGV